ncbi:MAG: DUF6912 family protein [Actinomycetes bacterium]
MRVYLPSTFGGLESLRASAEVGPPPLYGCAVTPGLREWYAVADLEELEYVALTEAAGVSLRLLPAGGGRRRIVLAADVPDDAVTAEPGSGRAAVRVATAVPLRRVAALHVDGHEAEGDVAAAVEALARAEAGEPDAVSALEDAQSHELAWYAVQELDALLGAR